MIEIVKGEKVLKVPTSAFANFYQGNGWVIAGTSATPAQPKTKKEVKKEQIPEVKEEPKDEWDEVLEESKQPEEIEKPLSEMSKSELKKKATSLGIDISGQSYTNNELRDMIREAQG